MVIGEPKALEALHDLDEVAVAGRFSSLSATAVKDWEDAPVGLEKGASARVVHASKIQRCLPSASGQFACAL